MTYENDQELLNYKRALIFFEDKDIIHVSTKNKIPNTNKFIFYNGRILERPNEQYFIIHDRIEGRKKVFYFELRKPIVLADIEEVRDKEIYGINASFNKFSYWEQIKLGDL
ncbi:MAG: hypothetical protein ACTSRZ_20420 [Promethearchaeota archaeon]